MESRKEKINGIMLTVPMLIYCKLEFLIILMYIRHIFLKTDAYMAKDHTWLKSIFLRQNLHQLIKIIGQNRFLIVC